MSALRQWGGVFCGLVAIAQMAAAGDWPTWRGADRRDICTETGLLKEWPTDGPSRLWMNGDVGLGYSGCSIVDGKLFTLGARDDVEFLICIDTETGKEVWSQGFGPKLGNGWGDGPRGTPSVDGDRVYAISGTGVLICANIKAGETVWKKKMTDLGGKAPGWGYCESFLIDGPRAVCTPGGDRGTVAALDKLTGDELWRTTDLKVGAQYSSIVPATVHGQLQYVQLFMDKFAGINPEDGKVFWMADFPGKTAVIPTPIVHDDSVFITAGYGVGCTRVSIDGDNKVSEAYFNKNMKNHHGGVIQIGDCIYGHSDGVGWMCLNFKTGEIVWNEKSALRKGCVTCADGMLYCVDEDSGDVALVEASPAGWREHGRFKLAPQTSRRNPKGRIWTHPVVANGKLYLRDQELLMCYDVKAK